MFHFWNLSLEFEQSSIDFIPFPFTSVNQQFRLRKYPYFDSITVQLENACIFVFFTNSSDIMKERINRFWGRCPQRSIELNRGQLLQLKMRLLVFHMLLLIKKTFISKFQCKIILFMFCHVWIVVLLGPLCIDYDSLCSPVRFRFHLLRVFWILLVDQ